MSRGLETLNLPLFAAGPADIEVGQKSSGRGLERRASVGHRMTRALPPNVGAR